MLKVTEPGVDVIVYPSALDKTKNRGFAFIEYESHRAAAMARRKLVSSPALFPNSSWIVDVCCDSAVSECLAVKLVLLSFFFLLLVLFRLSWRIWAFPTTSR